MSFEGLRWRRAAIDLLFVADCRVRKYITVQERCVAGAKTPLDARAGCQRVKCMRALLLCRAHQAAQLNSIPTHANSERAQLERAQKLLANTTHDR